MRWIAVLAVALMAPAGPAGGQSFYHWKEPWGQDHYSTLPRECIVRDANRFARLARACEPFSRDSAVALRMAKRAQVHQCYEDLAKLVRDRNAIDAEQNEIEASRSRLAAAALRDASGLMSSGYALRELPARKRLADLQEARRTLDAAIDWQRSECEDREQAPIR